MKEPYHKEMSVNKEMDSPTDPELIEVLDQEGQECEMPEDEFDPGLDSE